MAQFKKRKSAYPKNSKYYNDGSINPWAKKGIGSCTQYAQARILELTDLCNGKMRSYKDSWYPIDMYNKCSEVGGTRINAPSEGGCFGVWQNKNGSHIASVEAVLDSDNIYISQQNSKSEFSYVKLLAKDNYKIDGYTLVGFFTLNLKWDGETESATTKTLNEKSYPDYQTGQYYRVRRSWKNVGSQLGAYSVWANAYHKWESVKANGYHVYDNNGKQLD